MNFDVIDFEGNVKMSTSHQSCIYSFETLEQMMAAGYTFRLNGKRWKPNREKANGVLKPAQAKTREKGAIVKAATANPKSAAIGKQEGDD